ncbi:hypothetical protein FOPE_11223 [Fonsecaea pedrosoi]|nr:hypothetical protein FOPE_11223 [Fonsecaea pedrosoi]
MKTLLKGPDSMQPHHTLFKLPDSRRTANQQNSYDGTISPAEPALASSWQQHNELVLDNSRPVERPSSWEEQSPFCPENTPTLYEGGSSFVNQSTEASDIATRTADSDDLGEGSGLGPSLNSLKSLLNPCVNSPSAGDFHFFHGLAPPARPSVPLIPADLVLAVLRRIKTHKLPHLQATLCDSSLVERLCQKVYFPVEPVSLGHVTSMHGLLFYVLQDCIVMRDPLGEIYDLPGSSTQCARNFSAGIETYELLAIPSFESILALTIAIMKAQDDAKPWLCSTFLSAAARHCQVLGYHRETTYQNDNTGNRENMRRLFWSIYMFDKNMSLYFGRASNIQDFEIDTGYPAISTDPGAQLWDQATVISIQLARLQGQIYDRLYSPSAQKASHSERERRIDDLASQLEEWHIETRKTMRTGESAAAPLAMGGGPFSKSFRELNQCLVRILLFSTFAPFIAVFLHAVVAASFEDVLLLDQVVDSLKPTRAASHRTERLYQVCSTFAKLARDIVERTQGRRSDIEGRARQESVWPADSPTQAPSDRHQSLDDIFEYGMMGDIGGAINSGNLSDILNSCLGGGQSWAADLFETGP